MCVCTGTFQMLVCIFFSNTELTRVQGWFNCVLSYCYVFMFRTSVQHINTWWVVVLLGGGGRAECVHHTFNHMQKNQCQWRKIIFIFYKIIGFVFCPMLTSPVARYSPKNSATRQCTVHVKLWMCGHISWNIKWPLLRGLISIIWRWWWCHRWMRVDLA